MLVQVGTYLLTVNVTSDFTICCKVALERNGVECTDISTEVMLTVPIPYKKRE